jgi:urease accessory protein
MSVAAKPVQNVAGGVGSPETRPALRLRATLALDFSYDASSRRTILSSSAQEPPLRVVRAFDNPDSSALAHLHNVSGGLLGGDQLKLCVNVGPRASAQITTSGATRIYRPRAAAPTGGAPTSGPGALLEYAPDAAALRKGTASAVPSDSADLGALAPEELRAVDSSTNAAAFRKGTASAVPSGPAGPGALAPEGPGVTIPSDAPCCTQTNEIKICQSALLEYVPDAIIPFAGARFAQRTTIHLEENAGLFWWEILVPGREARGELFEYERVEMRADIFSRGRLIFAENARLEPNRRELSSLARLGPYRYWATFFICRAGLDSPAWLAEEVHLREAAIALNRPDEVLWGISTLVADGLVIRGVARRGRDLVSGLHHLWNAAKLRLYGREAVRPRKLP